MKSFFRTTIGAALLCYATAFGQNSNGEPVTATEAFDLLKSLAGEWQGTIQEKETGTKAGVTYRVTAKGKVVLETLFPGTDHEMVTAYHLDGSQVVLTHYCTSGNHPQMALDKQSTNTLLSFTFSRATNFNAEKDMHMHSCRLKLTDNDHLECEWDAYKDGKLVSVNKFFLTRKK